jgi:hypothetical protein
MAVLKFPHATAVALDEIPKTWTGVERSVVSFTPSLPELEVLLAPKVLTVPSAKRTAVWLSPAATAMALDEMPQT